MKFLFDWNGTIADDAARACFATNVALDAVGAPRIELLEFDRKFILPMDEMFLRLGVSGQDLASATSHWNKAMASRQAPIRAGAARFLRALHDAGEYCAVISAAGEQYLREELAYFGLADCFDEVLTGASDKIEALEGLRQDGQALYFGDTERVDCPQAFRQPRGVLVPLSQHPRLPVRSRGCCSGVVVLLDQVAIG